MDKFRPVGLRGGEVVQAKEDTPGGEVEPVREGEKAVPELQKASVRQDEAPPFPGGRGGGVQAHEASGGPLPSRLQERGPTGIEGSG